jgi:peptidoglycan/LPS O-acetylase OafA/YrhL
MASTLTRAKTYFPALTGIRAVAAFIVVAFHMAQPLRETATGWRGLPVQLMLEWHIGVAVFFVLSGFLITNRYANKIELTGAWFRRYMQNRFARIYPIYFLLTAVSFLLLHLTNLHPWYHWHNTDTLTDKAAVLLLNFTLTRAYFEQFATVGLPTAWSLTVEETFYLLAPLLLVGLKQSQRRIIFYPLIFLSLGFLLVLFCSHFVPVYGLMASARYMLNFTFFGRCAEFVFGMGLALWVAKQPTYERAGLRYTALGTGGILIFVAAMVVLHHFHPVTGPAQFSYGQIIANNFILPLFVCSLFWGLLSEQSQLRRLLESKPFDLLGRSSYVLYLLHLGTFDTLFRQYISANNFVCLLAYTLASVALYKFIEHPLHLRLRFKA